MTKKPIHISQVRRLLNSRQPLDLTVVTSKGEVQEWKRAVSCRPNVRGGYRNVRISASGEIRKLRDVLIIGANGHEVYL